MERRPDGRLGGTVKIVKRIISFEQPPAQFLGERLGANYAFQALPVKTSLQQEVPGSWRGMHDGGAEAAQQSGEFLAIRGEAALTDHNLSPGN